MLTFVMILYLAADVPPATSSTQPNGGDASFTTIGKKTKTYPWKRNIIATMFYIGETSSKSSAWDANWESDNGGADVPQDRNGYAPAGFAPTRNTFYVALPFNDLAFPGKAKIWLPEGWQRPARDGKPVSACQDRWVEIKNAEGETCYAQWEDVGPRRNDHAEYVFGPERPAPGSAGIDVSPAVAKYLSLGGKDPLVSWRFVDPADVPPGFWLKYDEQAVLYSALREMKSRGEIAPTTNAAAGVGPMPN